jgi:hypothetical protein
MMGETIENKKNLYFYLKVRKIKIILLSRLTQENIVKKKTKTLLNFHLEFIVQ